MKLDLYLINEFTSTFKDVEYHIYQFVDANSLVLLSHSSTEDLHLELNKKYTCVLGIKKAKLCVKEVKLSQ